MVWFTHRRPETHTDDGRYSEALRHHRVPSENPGILGISDY